MYYIRDSTWSRNSLSSLKCIDLTATAARREQHAHIAAVKLMVKYGGQSDPAWARDSLSAMTRVRGQRTAANRRSSASIKSNGRMRSSSNGGRLSELDEEHQRAICSAAFGRFISETVGKEMVKRLQSNCPIRRSNRPLNAVVGAG